MTLVPFEAVEAIDIRPPPFIEYPLPGDQDVGILDESFLSILFHRQLPLTRFLLPDSFSYSVVEFDITIEIPLLDCALDVFLDLSPRGVEVFPIWFRVKWKCLRD